MWKKFGRKTSPGLPDHRMIKVNRIARGLCRLCVRWFEITQPNTHQSISGSDTSGSLTLGAKLNIT